MATTIGVQYAVDLPGLPARDRLRRWGAAALSAAGGQGAFAIRLVDEAESASLNKRWRGKDGPTNVLSFPAELPPGVTAMELGDVIICVPVVLHEASVQKKNPDAHFAHMVAHGVLHLLGYDHEASIDAAEMEALETEILASLGYPDPYLPD